MDHILSGLKPRRTLLDIKAVDIADRLGITLESYYRIERGQRRIYFDKAVTISRFTGISLEDLTREPTDEERVDLFKAGEHKRALQARSGGDEPLAAAIDELEHLGPGIIE
jgi:transcriptional regulator with XRE-family HTH domain